MGTDMTVAMHQSAEPSDVDDADAARGDTVATSDGDRTPDGVIDLSASTLYAPSPAAVPAAAPAPQIDADALAQMATEVAQSVARHRDELAAAMAELTALQRTLRGEVRAVVAELDRIAEGIAPVVAQADASDQVDPSTGDGARRWRRRRSRP